MINKLLIDREIINEILKRGGITFLFRMIAMACSFITIYLITNFFGKDNFGSYTICLTILQIVTMVFAFGVPNSFIFFSGKFESIEQTNALLFKAIKIVLLSSSIAVLTFLFGAKLIPEILFHKSNLTSFFIILALSIPFMILHELICYYFISIQKHLIYSLFFFIVPNVFFIFFLSLFYILKTPLYFSFLAYGLSYALTVILQLIALKVNKIQLKRIDISSKEIFKTSFPMMIGGLFLILLNWTDILMLGRMETESNIGIYNAAFKIGYLTLFFVVSMNVVIMPKASELFHNKKYTELKKVVNRATQIVILLTIPLACFIIFFSEIILNLFGDGFQAGKLTLIIITLGALFNAITGNVDQLLNMTGHQIIVRNVFFAGFLLNVVLNLFLIPKYGIEGAAFSSLFTNLIVNIIFVYIIKKKLGFYTFI